MLQKSLKKTLLFLGEEILNKNLLIWENISNFHRVYMVNPQNSFSSAASARKSPTPQLPEGRKIATGGHTSMGKKPRKTSIKSSIKHPLKFFKSSQI